MTHLTMTWLDWAIVAASVAALSWVSLRTVRHMKAVADFLSANRSAGRYMLTLAGAMSSMGAISAVAMFERFAAAGFPNLWWSWLSIPAGMVLTLTGWVYYRFRETRCMTLAQFFELRYSRRFRVFTGIVVWFSGITNFGIFPYVAANFFVYYCGFPETIHVFGAAVPTYWPIMLLTTGVALVYTCVGGQITVMVTDCIQGIFCGIAFCLLAVFLLQRFSWAEIVTTLEEEPISIAQTELLDDLEDARTAHQEASRTKAADTVEKEAAYEQARARANDDQAVREIAAEKSLLNPFRTKQVHSFNVWFYLILLFNMFYGAMAWQGSQAYQSSGINAHEQKMGGIIGLWRSLMMTMGLVLVVFCALVFLTQPHYASEAAPANAILERLDASDTPQLAVQQRIPVALGFMLPDGLRGLFCVVMVFLLVTTQDTYLHSWGSIFVQDIVLPLRKKPLTPAQHVNWLRCSIAGVAVFALVFASIYRPNEYIQMYFAITGSIVSGLGPAIIGGLYWKRGSTVAAWVTVTIGAALSMGLLLIRQFEEALARAAGPGAVVDWIRAVNAVNSQYQWFFVMLACMASYIGLSLLFGKSHNMERLLHRGRYDTKGEHVKARDATRSPWMRLFAITEEFTFTDRILAFALVGWHVSWLTVLAVVTAVHYTIGEVSTEWFARFWRVAVWLNVGIGFPATVWFTFGGIRDMRRFFARLATLERDHRDDGHVAGDRLADEAPPEP